MPPLTCEYDAATYRAIGRMLRPESARERYKRLAKEAADRAAAARFAPFAFAALLRGAAKRVRAVHCPLSTGH